MVTKADRRGNTGKNWSQSVELRDGKMWADSKTPFGRTSKKPEEDDRTAPSKKERNTGTTVAKRLAGKVIG
jgi:hypothetical protein